MSTRQKNWVSPEIDLKLIKTNSRLRALMQQSLCYGQQKIDMSQLIAPLHTMHASKVRNLEYDKNNEKNALAAGEAAVIQFINKKINQAQCPDRYQEIIKHFDSFKNKFEFSEPCLALNCLDFFNKHQAENSIHPRKYNLDDIKFDQIKEFIAKNTKRNIKCMAVSYHVFVAARELGFIVPIITANVLLFNEKHQSFILQNRSLKSLDYPQFYHVFGGALLAYKSHDCQYTKTTRKADDSIADGALRELQEEVSEMNPHLVKFDASTLKNLTVLVSIDPSSMRKNNQTFDHVPIGTVQFTFMGYPLSDDAFAQFQEHVDDERVNKNAEGQFSIFTVTKIDRDEVKNKTVPMARAAIAAFLDIRDRHERT